MNLRGTGITTRQMKNAPQNAVFVWVNSRLDYPKSLAREIGRNDLEIVSPQWLEGHGYFGRTLNGLIIDHATELEPRQIDGYYEVIMRIERL